MANAEREQCLSALLVGDYDIDRQLVHDIFHNPGWRLFEAQDRRHALRCLDRHPIQVVIAEADSVDGGWRRVLCDLRDRQQPAQLIVTSRQADDRLWAEALNLGAFDVLAQPFERIEVERAVEAAYRAVMQPAKPHSPVTVAAGLWSG